MASTWPASSCFNVRFSSASWRLARSPASSASCCRRACSSRALCSRASCRRAAPRLKASEVCARGAPRGGARARAGAHRGQEASRRAAWQGAAPRLHGGGVLHAAGLQLLGAVLAQDGEVLALDLEAAQTAARRHARLQAHRSSRLQIPVIGSMACGDQGLNCSVRGSTEPRIEQFSRWSPHAMEPIAGIAKRLALPAPALRGPARTAQARERCHRHAEWRRVGTGRREGGESLVILEGREGNPL